MIICFFGDSLTLGTNDPEFRGWPGRACQMARARGAKLGAHNLGIRSNRTNDILARLQDEAERRMPHPLDPDGRIVLSFGGADASAPGGLPRVDAVTSTRNASLLLKHAQSLCPTLLIGPPPMADTGFDARVAALSRAYANVAATAGVPYLDLYTPLSAEPAYREELAATDGVHPSGGGYERMAQLVDAWEPWTTWMKEAGAED